MMMNSSYEENEMNFCLKNRDGIEVTLFQKYLFVLEAQ